MLVCPRGELATPVVFANGRKGIVAVKTLGSGWAAASTLAPAATRSGLGAIRNTGLVVVTRSATPVRIEFPDHPLDGFVPVLGAAHRIFSFPVGWWVSRFGLEEKCGGGRAGVLLRRRSVGGHSGRTLKKEPSLPLARWASAPRVQGGMGGFPLLPVSTPRIWRLSAWGVAA